MPIIHPFMAILITVAILGICATTITKYLTSCRHKWTKPINREKTCTKCSTTRKVPCIHTWGKISEYTWSYWITIVLQCKECGDIEYKES